MRIVPKAALVCCMLSAGTVFGQQAAVLRDLESRSPVTLAKADLSELIPNAKMTRATANGNLHIWTNDPDGTFVASSDNRATSGMVSTAQGKWHISDDGRYCVLIQWRTAGAEEWCRFLIKTTDGYYTVKSVGVGTEKVYKFEVRK